MNREWHQRLPSRRQGGDERNHFPTLGPILSWAGGRVSVAFVLCCCLCGCAHEFRTGDGVPQPLTRTVAGTGTQIDGHRKFNWEKLAIPVADGVRVCTFDLILSPAIGMKCPEYDSFNENAPRRLSICAARVDMSDASIGLSVTGRADLWGQTMPRYWLQKLDSYTVRTVRQTALDFALEEDDIPERNVLIACNATGWRPFVSWQDHPYADKLGLIIREGVLVSPASSRRPALVKRRCGSVKFEYVEENSDLSGIQTAVGANLMCLAAGKPVDIAADNVLHPRTGLGLCPDKRYLYILVADGRQNSSQGLTISELGKWLRYLGAWDGVNMDGGGSSTFVWKEPQSGKLRLLNRPSGGKQRRNGSNMAIWLTDISKRRNHGIISHP